jgi:dethiobiotin synthetase
MRKLFITGIGTDVGKTIVAATITEALQADYWKPVQSGAIENTDTQKVKSLVSNSLSNFHTESYVLQAPLSPYAAAHLQNIEIDFSNIILPQCNKSNLVIEGAGGLMVPLNSQYFVIDLISKFDAEVILVVKNYLGSINHTLLSIELLKARKLKIAGIIFNGDANNASEEIIIDYGKLPVLGRIENLKNIDAAAILSVSKNFKHI